MGAPYSPGTAWDFGLPWSSTRGIADALTSDFSRVRDGPRAKEGRPGSIRPQPRTGPRHPEADLGVAIGATFGIVTDAVSMRFGIEAAVGLARPRGRPPQIPSVPMREAIGDYAVAIKTVTEPSAACTSMSEVYDRLIFPSLASCQMSAQVAIRVCGISPVAWYACRFAELSRTVAVLSGMLSGASTPTPTIWVYAPVSSDSDHSCRLKGAARQRRGRLPD